MPRGSAPGTDRQTPGTFGARIRSRAAAMKPTPTVALLLSFAASLAAQGPKPDVPLAKAWPEALRVATRHKAPILAFVVPPNGVRTDADTVSRTCAAERELGMLRFDERSLPPMRTQREVLLRQVQLLRAPEPVGRGLPAPTRCQALFALTVPVFANAVDCGAEAGETVVLCGPDGKRQAGWKLDLLDRAEFDEQVGGRVLAKQALEVRKANVAPALRADLAALRQFGEAMAKGGEQPAAEQARMREEYERLVVTLRDALPGLAPALVEHGDQDALRFAAELAAFEAQRLPLGVSARLFDGDPCPTCGMGYVPPGLRTVLELIGP